MPIPQEHKQAVISTAMRFVKSITEAYGADEGIKLWENISAVLDPDVKGEMFFAMITGQYRDQIVITGYKYKNGSPFSAGFDIISAIKTIREYDNRRLGLKESKDLMD